MSVEEVELTVTEPDRVTHNDDGDPCYQRRIGGRVVKVVLLQSDLTFVKTVIVLS